MRCCRRPYWSGGTIPKQCLITVCCVAAAGGVVDERLITSGRIGVAGGVFIERLITARRVADPARVRVEHIRTNTRVVVACIVVIERIESDGRVALGTAAKTFDYAHVEESISTLGGGFREPTLVVIAAIRWWRKLRPSRGRKRKRDHGQDECG